MEPPTTGSPIIQISTSQGNLDCMTTCVPEEDSPRYLRQRSPSRSPRSTSIILLPSPPGIDESLGRCLSVTSGTSSTTLVVNDDSSSTSQCEPILDKPLTAEPEHFAAEHEEKEVDEKERQKERKIFLATSPVGFSMNLRYKHRETIEYEKLEGYSTVKSRNDIPSREKLVGGKWEALVHPEGSIYFRYGNMYTNVYLYDEDKLHDIERTVELLLKELAQHQISLDDVEVGLDRIIDEEDDVLGCYYLCDKRTEEVFWLKDVAVEFFHEGGRIKVMGREHLSEIGCHDGLLTMHVFISRIRDHVYMFPHDRKLAKETLQDLQSDCRYYMFDRETSATSNSPYTTDVLHRLLQVTKEIEPSHTAEDPFAVRPQDMAIIGRLKAILSRERYIRYHGERYAQLDSDRSVYEATHQHRSITFNLFTWAFFTTPQVYFDRLNKVWVDDKVNYQGWRHFIGELQDDWTASITPATIILTANIGFLAIQSVDQGGVAQPNRTMGQIVSYISTLLSIGNILACTILARQHRPSTHQYADDAVAYFGARAGSPVSLERLAIIFSIPTALFLWALLTFSIAILWVCFFETSAVTQVLISITIVVTVMLLGGIVYNGDWLGPEDRINSLLVRTEKMMKLVESVNKVPAKLRRTLRSLSQDAKTLLSWKKTSRSSGGVVVFQDHPTATPGVEVCEMV